MRNIKTIYWVFAAFFALLTFLFACQSKEDDRAYIILSGAALVTSSIALGLSDKKQSNFKGKIIVWSVLLGQNVADENSNYRVSMKIINKSVEPVYDVVYRLRIPNRISARIDIKNSNARDYRHGKSLIIVDDSYGFLATDGQDGFIPIDFRMQLGKWKESTIYITVSGSNIRPTTFKINPNDKDKIIAATQKKPLEVSRI